MKPHETFERLPSEKSITDIQTKHIGRSIHSSLHLKCIMYTDCLKSLKLKYLL